MTDKAQAHESKRWRKKPVVIEAWEWNESLALLDALKKRGMKWSGHSGHRDHPDLCRDLRIRTLEGLMDVAPGAYIIRGVRGEFYACDPQIFAATYEPAESNSSLLSQRDALVKALEDIEARATDHWQDTDADRRRNLDHCRQIAKFALAAVRESEKGEK
jgi:hypothetical protein